MIPAGLFASHINRGFCESERVSRLAMVVQTEQVKKIDEFLDDGIGLHRSRQRAVSTPNSLHPSASRASHVHLGVISNEDRRDQALY